MTRKRIGAARSEPGSRHSYGVLAAAVASMLGSAGLQSVQAAEPILWPHTGVFPAYEREEEESFEVYGIAEATADENIFRLADDTPLVDEDDRGDVYVRLGAGVRGDAEFSKQQFRYDLRADHYAFDQFSEL